MNLRAREMAPRLRTLILKGPNESLDFDTCECVHKAHLSLHTETSYSITQTKSFSRKSLRNPVREVLSEKNLSWVGRREKGLVLRTVSFLKHFESFTKCVFSITNSKMFK